MNRVWIAAAGAFFGMVSVSAAQTNACFDVDTCKVATDRPASVLVFPKIVVDPTTGTDTVVHLVNTGGSPVTVRCSYLNANGHCSDTQAVCRTSADCPGSTCIAGWSETDFRVTLTRFQPISWNASRGLSSLPCDILSSQPCQERSDGRIPPVAEEPFLGELKCIQVDDADAPVDFNELVGEATTIRAQGGELDVSKYNAIGIQAIPGANDGNNTLCLGGAVPNDDCPSGPEYAGCPQTLIMDHFFDDAELDGLPPLTSRLSLVPCAEDLLNSTVSSITVQFLLFNEFEQRTSTSMRFRCLADVQLSSINPIFSVSTQATLAGQTRISAVAAGTAANGVIGLLEERRECSTGPEGICTTTVNLHQQGRRLRTDIIRLP